MSSYRPTIINDDFVSISDLSFFNSGTRLALASLFFEEKMKDDIATFDLFVRDLPLCRNYFMLSGLNKFIEFILNFRFNQKQIAWIKKHFNLSPELIKYFKNFKFTGDIWAMPEGTLFFPNEPIIRITAPIIEAQIVETYLINCVYLETILASKISRFINAANGTSCVMGINRTYGLETAMKADRIKDIFGVSANSLLFNYKSDTTPWFHGTFHYLIMMFNNELDAFIKYLKHTGGKGYVLVDTYDCEKGIKNFITAARELEKFGAKAVGIQLDSGDLLELSRTARKMFDEAGLDYLKIFAMSNLDEKKVAELVRCKAPIDVFAGTTEILTPTDYPILELVYKLSEVRKNGKIIHKMKTATNKISLPGRKQVFRVMKNGKHTHDVIGLENEKVSSGKKLLQPIFRNGELISKVANNKEIRKHYFKQKSRFNPKLFSVDQKFNYPVKVSQKLKILASKTRKEIVKSYLDQNL